MLSAVSSAQSRGEGTVCPVCPHRCQLREGHLGLCKARRAVEGVSVPVNYGQLTALALDPIEKKPLAFFHPGTRILSVGSFGCNLDCPFCQNDDISTAGPNTVPTEHWEPGELAAYAESLRQRGNIGVAYTYNEPLIGFEFVRDTAIEVHERGMLNVMVTNGYATHEVLSEVLPFIDAFNIDLKAFSEGFYRTVSGDLETVKESIVYATSDAHVELTTLIVPGMNDSEDEMRAEAAWIAALDPEIPLHITRFFPRRYMRDAKPTSIALMERLASIAREYLAHVVLGNV